MGSGLREYKKKMRAQIGSDALQMHRIQSNYGEAIRNNSEMDTMKTAIFAVYHHMIKDNELTLIQQHKYCPMYKNTCCKFWQDKLHGMSCSKRTFCGHRNLFCGNET